MEWFDKQDVISAVRCLESKFNFYEMGQMYGIPRVHFWRASRREYVSPSLRDALGMWPDKKPRYRVAFEFDTEQEQQEMIRLLDLVGKSRKRASQLILSWLMSIAVNYFEKNSQKSSNI